MNINFPAAPIAVYTTVSTQKTNLFTRLTLPRRISILQLSGEHARHFNNEIKKRKKIIHLPAR